MSRSTSYPAIKRSLDIVVALVALCLAAPIMAGIGLAVRADSPGPAFFLQERVGLGGRIFRVFKFRTMRTDLNGPVLTQVGDPRITRIGAWLRRTSVDELPQLLNILFGDMSLIGPRPEVPSIVATYPESWRRVFEVRPGLTGWAQIHGRDDLDIPTKIGLDMDYVANLRFGLDWRIFWRTFPLLLAGTGIK
jgi:lipopolysaccharide/colanic/teichoic acid biosynthesis glycosyltransferase